MTIITITERIRIACRRPVTRDQNITYPSAGISDAPRTHYVSEAPVLCTHIRMGIGSRMDYEP